MHIIAAPDDLFRLAILATVRDFRISRSLTQPPTKKEALPELYPTFQLTRATTVAMMLDMTTPARFLVRSAVNRSLILCTDGEFHVESIVGPGGYCAKLYKTHRGASAVRGGDVEVFQCDERGVEIR